MTDFPKPEAFAAYEGGLWQPINCDVGYLNAHAVRYSDGSIWDVRNGWRPKVTDRHEAECARVEAEFNGMRAGPLEQGIRLECLMLSTDKATAQAFVDFVLAGPDHETRLECLHLAREPHTSVSRDDPQTILVRAAEYYGFVSGLHPQ